MKRFRIAVALIVLALGIWLGRGTLGPLVQSLSSAAFGSGETRSTSPDHEGKPKTRAGSRQPKGSEHVHGPERLQAFMLPDVVIDGEPLAAALKKLMTAYEEACHRTGEHPLQLTFVIAPGERQNLRVHLGNRNLNTSIRLLGALAGMNVSRSGLEYRFDHAGNDRKVIHQTLPLPRNFERTLKLMTGESVGGNLSEQLAKLGFQIDPSTKLTMNGDEGLAIETGNPADFTAISAMVKLLAEEPQVQHRFTANLIEIPADSNLETAESHWLDVNGVERFMHDMRQTPGAKVLAFPSSGTFNGEPATFEIFNGPPYPTECEEGDVERGQLNLLRLKGSMLGFENQLNVDFTSEDRTMGVSPRNETEIDERVIIKDEDLHGESGTRIVVHTRADGSKVLLVVTSTPTVDRSR